MAHIESFSTVGLDQRRKLAHWNDYATDSINPLVSDPADVRTFNGSIARTKLGDITVADVYSDAQVVRHSRAHVARTRHSMFFLQLQMEGESINRQNGRVACLNAGDFSLCDSTRQYEIVFPRANRMLVMGIPDSKLRRHIACPESLVAIPMQASNGVCGLLSRFLRHFWIECTEALDEATAGRITAAILDLLGAAYADIGRAQPDRLSLANVHRIRIVNYIEAHLHDPELTPTHLAQACKITPRYLHHLFSEREETVARYIVRRRLDECARALACGAQRSRTITAIAFDYGFNSPTHFGRVFRARFGVTPREYRRDAPEAA
jgi:AraC family transcriptional regulator, positive regulator of tynA and feaB